MSTDAPTSLSEADVAGVDALVERARAADGIDAVGESVLLTLHHRQSGPAYAVRHDGDRVVGFAASQPLGAVDEVELVVDPTYRRRGVGTDLLRRLPRNRPRLAWAHGNLPAARSFAAARGFSPVRSLHRMRRALSEPLPDLAVPEGIVLRPFRVGTDDEDWVRVNAAAFAHHPEQGGMTLADLREREAEPWFDADGFLVAEVVGALGADLPTGSMAGFHWTKVHPAGSVLDALPVGEVYVVGIDPRAQGLGLGKLLTVAGLRYLREQRGLGGVILYVDDDNTAAMRLYAGLGFALWTTDVQYADTPPAAGS